MCIGCNGAAALLIWSTFLANQLRECAISPDSAIGTIGQPGKSDTPYEIRRAFSIMTGRLTVMGVSAAQAALWHKSDGIARRPRIWTDPFLFAEREVNHESQESNE